MKRIKCKKIFTRVALHAVFTEGSNVIIAEWHDENGEKYFCWQYGEDYPKLSWITNQALPSFDPENEAAAKERPPKFDSIKEVAEWLETHH